MDRLGLKDRVGPRCLARKRLVTARLEKTSPKKNASEKVGPTRTRLDNIFTKFLDKNGTNLAPWPAKIRKIFVCGAGKKTNLIS